MKWSLLPGRAVLDGYAEAWQALNERSCRAHPLLDLKFIAPLYECFASEQVLLAAAEDDDRVPAMALLQNAGKKRWQLFMPSQANIGPIMLDGNISPADHLAGLIRTLPDAWQLGLHSLDPLYCPLAEAIDPCIEKIPRWTTTYVDIQGSFAEFWSGKAKTLQQPVKRRLAALQKQQIKVDLRMLTDYGAMAAGVTQYARLESAGWKGNQGTAVGEDNVQGRFYTKVMQNFAHERAAKIFQLYFDDRLVASQLGIIQNHMLVFLKTTYDESMAAFGPGRLLDYLVIQHIFADRDIHRIENYTNASSEDIRWCSGTRTLYHVNYYRSRATLALAQARRNIASFFMRASRSAPKI